MEPAGYIRALRRRGAGRWVGEGVGGFVRAAAMRERRPAPAAPARCKLVLVGDVQCGKTAMLQVLAKDCYPEVSPDRHREPAAGTGRAGLGADALGAIADVRAHRV